MRRQAALFCLIGLAFSCKPHQDSSQLSSSADGSQTPPPAYNGAQLQSKAQWGYEGQRLRVSWKAKPAQGDCVITLFSLFNAKKLFGQNQGRWSEIAFEIFGGSAKQPSAKAFQSQIITYNNQDDPSTQRRRQHRVNHYVNQAGVAPIFDNAFHDFQIEWAVGQNQENQAEVIFRVDGTVIRREKEGDLKRLEPQLETYTSVWVTRESNSSWGCTDASKERPEASHAVLAEYKVETLSDNTWQLADYRNFTKPKTITKAFYVSDYGFEGFDGVYCSSNIVLQEAGFVQLGLDRSCSASASWIDPETNISYPYCTSSSSDPEGDGWGSSNNQRCKAT